MNKQKYNLKRESVRLFGRRMKIRILIENIICIYVPIWRAQRMLKLQRSRRRPEMYRQRNSVCFKIPRGYTLISPLLRGSIWHIFSSGKKILCIRLPLWDSGTVKKNIFYDTNHYFLYVMNS